MSLSAEQRFVGGTIVCINAWVLHYGEKTFPEPGKCIPEHWLESGEKKLAEMERSLFAFSAGRLTCTVKNISLREMRKIISQLLREYKIALGGPNEEWKTKNAWFVQQRSVDCVFSFNKGKKAQRLFTILIFIFTTRPGRHFLTLIAV